MQPPFPSPSRLIAVSVSGLVKGGVGILASYPDQGGFRDLCNSEDFFLGRGVEGNQVLNVRCVSAPFILLHVDERTGRIVCPRGLSPLIDNTQRSILIARVAMLTNRLHAASDCELLSSHAAAAASPSTFHEMF